MKSATTLYIIHGWTYTTNYWEKTIKLLAEKGLRIKMLNVPGLTSPSTAVWDIDKYVAWADQNLPKNCVVLGHSNGGRILLNLASQDPTKIKHLILLNSAGVYRRSLKTAIFAKIAKIFAIFKRIKVIRKIFHKLIGASDYAHAPQNMQKTLSNMLDSDQNLDVTQVKTRTSILWGGLDQVTKLRDGELLHQKIAHSSLKIIPNWDHAPYIKHPKRLADEIFAVLKKEHLL